MIVYEVITNIKLTQITDDFMSFPLLSVMLCFAAVMPVQSIRERSEKSGRAYCAVRRMRLSSVGTICIRANSRESFDSPKVCVMLSLD